MVNLPIVWGDGAIRVVGDMTHREEVTAAYECSVLVPTVFAELFPLCGRGNFPPCGLSLCKPEGCKLCPQNVRGLRLSYELTGPTVWAEYASTIVH